MDRRKEILKELQELSPLLAALPYQNPFRTPEGYFSVNEERTTKGVIASERTEDALPIFLQKLKYKNPFLVPTTYFAENEEATLIAVGQKQTSISKQLADVRKNTPFLVPDSYFENNLEAVMAAVSEQEDVIPKWLADLRTPNPFQVPTGYFAENSEAVLAGIRKGELELPAVLATMKKQAWNVPVGYFASFTEKMMVRIQTEEGGVLSGEKQQPFSVPETYFEELPNKVLQRIREEKGAKVIPMDGGERAPEDRGIFRRLRPLMGVAAAVMLFLIGGLLFMNVGIGGPAVVAETTDWKTELQSMDDAQFASLLSNSIAEMDDIDLADGVDIGISSFLKNVDDEVFEELFLNEVDGDLNDYL